MTIPQDVRGSIEGYAVETPVLQLLTISHPTLIEPVRIVANSEDVVSQGRTFRAMPISFVGVEIAEDGVVPGRLEIDATDLGIQYVLAQVAEPLDLTVEVVMANDPDRILSSWSGLLLVEPQVVRSGETMRASMRATVVDYTRVAYPDMRFGPALFPGLFA